MKRFWIGLGILAAVLALGIWAMVAMDHIHSAVSEELMQAARIAMESGVEPASALAESARADWERHWHLSASLANHGEMDAIDATFAQLEVYQQRQETTAYAAACAHLAQLIEAIEEPHSLSWWNLL